MNELYVSNCGCGEGECGCGGGGAWSYGNPITPEYTLTNGHVVQYFEYTRFEYLPEGDEFGNLVRFGHLGEERMRLLTPVLIELDEEVARKAAEEPS